ncbi:MAG TPA: class I SAM-dependent methyltransferase [Pseudonocardia sp.]|jgi:SAM-dependent methyltransferase|nr:class I SAM-dependent methyltransferase [Pseudonocardia sp.]
MEEPAGWGLPLYARALDGVPAGASVLDVGCGPGAFAAFALDRGLRVTGIDEDRRAVAAATAAVPGAEFRTGDAHRPDFPDGSFDVVACIQVLAHVTNPLKVLRESARLVVPGGRIVATVWGREEECDVRAFGESLAAFLPPRDARRTPGGPPPLTEPDRFRKIAGMAGLDVVALDEVTCAFDYPDEDALLGPLLLSDIGRYAANRAGPAVVRKTAAAGLARFRTKAGGYRLNNLFRVLEACPAARAR